MHAEWLLMHSSNACGVKGGKHLLSPIDSRHVSSDYVLLVGLHSRLACSKEK